MLVNDLNCITLTLTFQLSEKFGNRNPSPTIRILHRWVFSAALKLFFIVKFEVVSTVDNIFQKNKNFKELNIQIIEVEPIS